MPGFRFLQIGRDRSIFLSGAAAVTALAWFYLVRMASDTDASGGHVHAHQSLAFTAAFLMWTVMMIAMMLPSALPFVFAFGAEHRARRARNLPYLPASTFLAGYFAMWTAFSAIAAVLQEALHRAALLSSQMSASAQSSRAAFWWRPAPTNGLPSRMRASGIADRH